MASHKMETRLWRTPVFQMVAEFVKSFLNRSESLFMKIVHSGHIGIEHKAFLEANGVQHEPWLSASDSNKIVNYMFEMDEAHQAWPEMKVRLGTERTFISTEFSEREISEADWSIAWATHSIYALRPGDYGWSTDFFADQCKNCGAGWRQIAPFRIKKEPKLGKNMFANFGSAFELFCVPAVLETLKDHGMSGFETRHLILNKKGRPAESLKQLVVTEVAQPAVADELVEHDRYSHTDCPLCGRTWHAHCTRGALPLRGSALNPTVDFQLTNEWFGNGRTARHEILFSRRVVKLALENNWQGIQFIPIHVV